MIMQFPKNRVEAVYDLAETVRRALVEDRLTPEQIRRTIGEDIILDVINELARGTNVEEPIRSIFRMMELDRPARSAA